MNMPNALMDSFKALLIKYKEIKDKNWISLQWIASIILFSKNYKSKQLHIVLWIIFILICFNNSDFKIQQSFKASFLLSNWVKKVSTALSKVE